MAKLNKRTVDAERPKGRDHFVWDEDLAGFGLRVFASGKKSYLVQYKAQGRTRRLTIGPHGPVTAEQARTRALQLLGRVRGGENPAEDRADEINGPTVNDLANRYEHEWAKRHKKPSSAAEDKRMLKTHILPALGKRKVKDVTRSDIEKLHVSLSTMKAKQAVDENDQGPLSLGGSDEIWRASPYRANRARALLSKMFALAEEWNWRPERSNPCRGVKPLKESRRDRFLSADEIAALAKALAAAKEEKRIQPAFASLVWLLLSTGCRLSEILTLRWAEVDFERGMLHLPDSKSGKKAVHLNTLALSILARIERVKDNPYVIVGAKPKSHLVGVQKAWQRLRAMAGLEGVRIHDLRHTYASVMAGLGEGLLVIGKALGHNQAATTARYAHLAADPVMAAVQRVGDAIAGMAEGKAATVVPMKARHTQ